MEVRHAFLADYFSSDSEGKFFIAGGFSQVMATAFPAAVVESKLVVIIDSEVGDSNVFETLSVRLRRCDPDLIVSQEAFDVLPMASIVPEGAAEGTPIILNVPITLEGLAIPAPGKYYFDIFLGDKLEQSLKLTVNDPKDQEQNS